MAKQASIYTIPNADIRNEAGSEYTIAPAFPAWFIPLVGGGLFTALAVALISTGGNRILFGVFVLSITVATVSARPISASLTMNFTTQQIYFSTYYLLRRPHPITLQATFADIERMDFRPVAKGTSKMVDIDLKSGARISLDFGKRFPIATRLLARFKQVRPPENAPVAAEEASLPPALPPTPASAAAKAAANVQAYLNKELSSWMLWLALIAIAQFAAAQGFSFWGALLLIVAAGIFFFKDSAMLVVLACTMAIAGIDNILSGDMLWIGFGVFQFILVWQQVRQFLKIHKVEKAIRQQDPLSLPATPASRVFPWVAFGIGLCVSLGSVILLFGAIILARIYHFGISDSQVGFGFESQLHFAYLGISLGLAGLLSGFPKKGLSITGLVLSALYIIAMILMVIIK
jgi:hypothetical protein